MLKSNTVSFLLGAALASAGVGLAAVDDAKGKLRDLAPTFVTTRIDLSIDEGGNPVASIRQRGVLTADARGAGVDPPVGVLDNVACQANVMDTVLAACPVPDGAVIPAYKTP